MSEEYIYFIVVDMTTLVLREVVQVACQAYVRVIVKHVDFVLHMLVIFCNSVELLGSIIYAHIYIILFEVNNVKHVSEHGTL